MNVHTTYRGRFAPSPSGPLHLGSLMCAVASYVDARANRGKWLLRIDDIDPPREMPGAAEDIINSLKTHGLQPDEPIIFQSQRDKLYRGALQYLDSQKLSYRCACSRKRLRTLSNTYDGFCRDRQVSCQQPSSVRLNLDKAIQFIGETNERIHFEDLIQGAQKDAVKRGGDYIIHRKDGFFAYQLAVVVEDIDQKITHIVRGADLLDTTGRHIFLTQLLSKQNITFAHIPILIDNSGNKLSKQNHAPPIDNMMREKNLYKALKYLGQNPPTELQSTTVGKILTWALEHWNIEPLKQIEFVRE